MVTKCPSTSKSLFKNPTPIVCKSWVSNLLDTYLFIRELFPTPPSPRRITLKSDDFPNILNLKISDFRTLNCSVQILSLSLGLSGRSTWTRTAGKAVHHCARRIIGAQGVSRGHTQEAPGAPGQPVGVQGGNRGGRGPCGQEALAALPGTSTEGTTW